MSILQRLYWPIFATTVFYFAFITLVVLPDITRDSGGLQPLDFFLEGYSFGEAMTFLATISINGGQAFADFHATHDMVFPALYGVTLAAALWLLDLGWSKTVRVLVSLVPLAAMAVDYLENAMLIRLTNMDVELITPELVAKASQLTETKFLLVALSFGILLVVLGRNLLANAPAVKSR